MFGHLHYNFLNALTEKINELSSEFNAERIIAMGRQSCILQDYSKGNRQNQLWQACLIGRARRTVGPYSKVQHGWLWRYSAGLFRPRAL